jgi:aspartate ammonia-lyase
MKLENMDKFLQKIELFKDLTDAERKVLIDHVDIININKGEYLFKQNTPRQRLFVIFKGRIELVKTTAFGEETVMTYFEACDFLGEGALMDNYPHSTSAKATEDTVLIAIHRDRFNELMNEQSPIVPKMLSRISRIISRRMRETTNLVVNAAAQYISGRTRLEHDLLGEREVPYEFYYGIQTLRATENFPISGVSIYHFPDLIVALAQVKKGAALANHELGLLTDEMTQAICQACDEIIQGKFHFYFVVDMIQGGAGTSTTCSKSSNSQSSF